MARNKILEIRPKIINIGLKCFGDYLKEQHVKVIHLDWQPPAGGDLQLLDLLEKLR